MFTGIGAAALGMAIDAAVGRMLCPVQPADALNLDRGRARAGHLRPHLVEAVSQIDQFGLARPQVERSLPLVAHAV